jgi:hypothetical protein
VYCDDCSLPFNIHTLIAKSQFFDMLLTMSFNTIKTVNIVHFHTSPKEVLVSALMRS